MSDSPKIVEAVDSLAYDPPQSLWQYVQSVANPIELDAIRVKIGDDLVEESLELHAEIDNLLEIWRDYRHETEQNLHNIRSSNQKKLLEPANVRNTLKREIELFVKQLRDQYKMETDRFNSQILQNHNLTVINYVMNVKSDKIVNVTSGPVERPKSSRSRLGFDTPTITKAKKSSALNEDIETIEQDKINFIDIDLVAEKIRTMLAIEIDQLKSDIEFLIDCLDKEKDYRTISTEVIREPTIYELKDERNKLESDLLSCKNLVKISKLPSSVSATNSNRSINSPVMNSRASPPTSAGSAKSVTSVRSLSKQRVTLKPNIVNTAQNAAKLKLDLLGNNSSCVDLNLSPSSSINSNKTSSSVQKFRKMVLESRD